MAYPTYGSWDFEGSQVSLTFDDGPTPGVTDRILNVLAREHVRAIFFVCGEYARRYPRLVRRAASEGHAIGNHSWSHSLLNRLASDALHRELSDTTTLIADLTGSPCRLFRPPHGLMNSNVLRTARELEMFTVLWTVCPRDWSCPGADVIVRRVMASVRPGAIVLLHDGCGDLLQHPRLRSICANRAHTIEALPHVIQRIRSLPLKLSEPDNTDYFSK